jgi:hypothetical protein
MPNKIVCETNNFLGYNRPTIEPIKFPNTDLVGFCLFNFDITETVNAYTPEELIIIRDAIDRAINENCKPSDIKGQTFLWDNDSTHLTKQDSEV